METKKKDRKLRRKQHRKYIKDKKQQERMDYIASIPIIKFVVDLDNKLFHKIFKTERGYIIRNFMMFISRLGDGYGWLALSICFFIFKAKDAPLIFTRALTTSFYCIITFIYIKNFVRRLRPYKKHNKTPLMMPPDIHSFPSGHTMVSFGLAMSMGTYNGTTTIIFYTISLLVGYSRIFVGLHYPMDVGVSIVIGSIIGLLNNILFSYITNMPILGH